VKIGVIGDFNPEFAPHPATNAAIRHAADFLGLTVEIHWLPTDSIGPVPAAQLAQFAGLWASPGSPYRNMAGALGGIRYAREHDVPLLGTCGGLQHMIVEFARNVLGFADAAHAEYDPYGSTLFVTPLSCSLAGKILPIRLSRESRAAQAYGAVEAVERYYCNFGLNPAYQHSLHQRGFRIVGTDASGEARILELPAHRFYVGTLFVPQARSEPGRPHPLIVAYLKTAASKPNAG
jgi:CTP synthase (UTP-ammonia lyase)